jgi:adenosine deaminase
LDALADIRAWPKVELHCHLEGAMRPATVRELLRRQHGDKADSIPIQLTGREQSFFDWIPIFHSAIRAVQTEADITRITREAIEDAASNGVIYLELRYAPFFMQEFNGLPAEAIIEAVCEGHRQAASIPTEFILIAQQSGGESECNAIVDLALKYRDQHHQAIDIAGDMTRVPLATYAPIFTRAHDAGLGATVHAGEVAPAYTVRTAVEGLHATRVGHGIRSIEDPSVVDMLKERDILLEVCISSNVQTRVVPSAADHPIRKLSDLGVRVSINTDDPGIQNIDLTGEYDLAMQTFGFTRADLGRFNRDAMRSAFTDEATRKSVIAQLEAAYA